MFHDKEKILELAKKYRHDPKKFVDKIEYILERSTFSANQISEQFVDISEFLYRSSYFEISLYVIHHTLDIFKTKKNKLGESACYRNLSLVHISLSQYEKSIEYCEKAVSIYQELDDKPGLVNCYLLVCIAHNSLSQYEKTVEYGPLVRKIPTITEEEKIMSRCYRAISAACASLSQYEKSIEYLHLALSIYQELDDKPGMSACYRDIGHVCNDLSQYEKSIEYLHLALSIYQELDDKPGMSACYMDLGNACASLSQYEKALEYFQHDLKIVTNACDDQHEIKCYNNLGAACASLSQYEKALEYFQLSLAKCKKLGDKPGEATCYANIASLHIFLSQYKEAIEYYKKALEITIDSKDQQIISQCYMNLGIAYSYQSQYEKALECYEKALSIFKEMNDKSGESACYRNLGDLYKKISQYEKAIEYYKNSISLSEEISSNIISENNQISFFETNQNAYRNIILSYIKLGQFQDAFEAVEKSKSKAFLSLLSTTENIKPTTEKIKIQDLQHEKKLLARKQQFQKRHLVHLASNDPHELNSIQVNLNELYSRMETHDPEYVYLRQGNSLSLERIQGILSAKQYDNTVIIEYFITADLIIIFVISRNSIDIRTSPISLKNFSTYFTDYINNVQKYEKYDENLVELENYWSTRPDLSKILISPINDVLNKLPKNSKIIFVPHGLLHLVPLHALFYRNEPIIQNYPISYLPNASMLQFDKNIERHIDFPTCSIFSSLSTKVSSGQKDPIEKENEDIIKLFDNRARFYPEVTKQKVVDNLDGNILHFSCHGLFDEKDPLSSCLMLSDGNLTARDIFRLRISADLVTLSSCETGINTTKFGDELIGLSRAILYSGAKCTLLSLWEIPTESTQKLMVQFYTNIKNRQNFAVALQNAQISIMNIPGYEHPYFWSGFVLIGNASLSYGKLLDKNNIR